MAKTAVVILNYNGEAYLKKFLPSVIAYSPEADVVVADNHSTDNSVATLKEEFPQVRLIELTKNLGYAGGYNCALAQVDADYYVLLNSDVEVTPNWITPIVSFLDQHEGYAACQPKILDYSNRDHFEYAGACGGFIDFLGYPYCRGRIFDFNEKDKRQYDESLDCFWASGACLFVRSSSFHQVGGFDEDFFAHMEEIDLCWRLHSRGKKVRAIPSSTVYHVGGGTLSKYSPFKTYLNFRNGLYMLVKNLPVRILALKLPVRVTLDWVAALKFVLEGNGRHALGVLRAHWSFLLSLRKMWKKRERVSITPKSRLMIYEYFIKGNKTFDEILPF